LRTRWIIVGIVAIIVASVLFDYYTTYRYPQVPITITGISNLKVGTNATFIFLRNDENIGNHSYRIVDIQGSGSSALYTIETYTFVTSNNKTLELKGRYTFNNEYLPAHYELNATQGGNTTTIICTFYDAEVNETVIDRGEETTLQSNLPNGTLLIENTMPAYWDILFRSTNMQQAKRYTGQIFIPQFDEVTTLSLFVEPNKSQRQLGDTKVDATVINFSDLSLIFYVYQGKLIAYRDDSQSLLFQKVV
jgi:hypothetical protein